MPAKYDESFKEQLDDLTSKYSDTEISSIIGLGRSNVHLLRQRLGILSFTEKTGLKKNPKTGDTMRGSFEKVRFNRKFFKTIDSEAKAYFLGLMITDGCVHSTMACASLGLKRSDEHILISFCHALDLEPSQVKQRDWIFKGRSFPASELYLSSSETCEDLVSHGVLAGLQKTTNCFLKTKLSEPLLRAFVRGVFDGDGSSSVQWTPRGTIDSSRTRIDTASKAFADQLASFFDAMNIKYKIGLTTQVTSPTGELINRKHPLYCIDFGAVRSNDFLPWIYKDATIYLKRKYNIWKEVLEKSVRSW